MKFIKNNFAILLAFILPISLIVALALSTYLPSVFLSTSYNFVYITCTDGINYYYSNCGKYLETRYSVVDNKIIANTVDPTLDLDKNKIPDIYENNPVRIVLHDTKKNESREITFEDAQAITLSSIITSPDGVTVSGHYNKNGGDFFFYIFGGGSYSYGHYLTKGKSRNKLNLINNTGTHYSLNNFKFLGWVLPGRN